MDNILTESNDQSPHELKRCCDSAHTSGQQTELFTATVAHDLRGSLNIITSGISLLQRCIPVAVDQRERIIEGMNKAVARMKEQINDIISFSKSGAECRHLELVDLGILARSTIADLQTSIESNNAKISIGELPVVCGDRSQLQQLFQNLLENALKYRKPDTDPNIIINCRAVSHDKISSKGFDWEISFEDNGRGFTNEEAEAIFTPFHRLSNCGIQGSGLGLAICQRVVDGHRGTVKAEGMPGQGAKFIIRIPSTELCVKSDSCSFASSSFEKKCPALANQQLA